MTDCSVCCETLNNGGRCVVKCPYCEYTCCGICFRTYLMGSSKAGADCMSCHRELALDFVSGVTPKNFHNDKYRRKRADDLLSLEKSLLPDTQHLVEARHRRIEAEKEVRDLEDEMRYLKERMREIRTEIYETRWRANGGGVEETKEGDGEKKKFIMGCPGEDCRGFLSQAWKCGTCNVYVCSKCRVIKNGRDDEDHVCKKEDIETCKLLANDTKPCPNCTVPIFKISGCFAPDTPVLTWNGNIKLSQDIDIGDELIGDDGTKRTVLSLTDGEDKMYKVSQKYGDDYIVNSKHTLVLKFSGNKTISWHHTINCWKMRWFDKRVRSKSIPISETKTKEQAYEELKKFSDDLTVPDPILITVEEYLKLTESSKKKLVGYKTEGVCWDYKPVMIDPYILGSWLGDGYSIGTSFCSNDSEIVKRWEEWAVDNDAKITNLKQKYRYYVKRNPTSAKRSNPLKEQLSKYNLVNNKHIPDDFLINSKEVRLQVLAGLIDTDGWVGNEGRRITIMQSNPILSAQIKFLAQSLGFRVSLTNRERKNDTTFTTEPKDYKDQQVINISGKYLAQIPTILPRKKCKDQEGGNDLLRTSIAVEYVGIGKYYGWSIDKNKRFLLGDFSSLKNCDQMYCTSCNTAFSWKTGRIETGVIHNPHFYQYQRQQNGGVAPRVPGDIPGGACGGLPYVLLMERTIMRKEPNFNNWGHCHQMVQHIQQVVRHRYPNRIGMQDNSDLRVQYLLKEIDDDKWVRTLRTRQKAAEKNRAIHNVLELLTVSLTDLFNTFVHGDGTNLEDSCKNLRNYVNTELTKIKNNYNNRVPYITTDWECITV